MLVSFPEFFPVAQPKTQGFPPFSTKVRTRMAPTWQMAPWWCFPALQKTWAPGCAGRTPVVLPRPLRWVGFDGQFWWQKSWVKGGHSANEKHRHHYSILFIYFLIIPISDSIIFYPEQMLFFMTFPWTLMESFGAKNSQICAAGEWCELPKPCSVYAAPAVWRLMATMATFRFKNHRDHRGTVASPQPGQLLLIDCAGTERRKDAMYHSKERQQEGAEINASLHALKDLIYLISLACFL